MECSFHLHRLLVRISGGLHLLSKEEHHRVAIFKHLGDNVGNVKHLGDNVGNVEHLGDTFMG